MAMDKATNEMAKEIRPMLPGELEHHLVAGHEDGLQASCVHEIFYMFILPQLVYNGSDMHALISCPNGKEP